jgi:eukaryotic-like serine/threonine-protein kinase
MNCPDAVKLCQLLNDELQGADYQQIEAHVENCPRCQESLDRLQAEGGEPAPLSDAGERYRALRFHARGGLGEVFVAEDAELHREVALKRMHARCEDDPESRRRFLLEAEITGRLEHPGLVPVYGLGQDSENRPCYAMRFICGETLEEAINRFHELDRPGRPPGERSLALRELLGRFVAVCKTVAYAHSRGILHRDLKPRNIMLGKYGETLVVDWGLAKIINRDDSTRSGGEEMLAPASGSDGSGTHTGAVMGTPDYMSPEQADGQKDVGPASDIYSLGVILYKLLTGKTPFAGGDAEAKLAKVKRGEFPRPRQVKKACPPALEAVCLKAMALQTVDRYVTALALADDVEHWLADEPVGAWREPWQVRTRRWVRQHRTVAAAVTTAMALAVLVGFFGYYLFQLQEAERGLQKAVLRKRVEKGLKKAADLRERGHWQEARVMVDQTLQWLGEGSPADLRELLQNEEAALDFVVMLEAIRLKKATIVNGEFDLASADREYGEFFRAEQTATEGEAFEAIAARVRNSWVAGPLLAALDDWAAVTKDDARRARVMAVARTLDPDEQRNRLRDPEVWKDRTELKRRVEEANAASLSPPLVLALGAALGGPEGNGVRLLTRGQRVHPTDFWLAFGLGNALHEAGKPDEAVGFYRIAQALRPETVAVHNNLGIDLADQGRLDEAIEHFLQALTLDPKDCNSHTNLGIALNGKGRLEEAIAHYQQALTLNPNFALAHNSLGNALKAKGQIDEAIAHYQQALVFNPKFAEAHANFGNALKEKGQLEEAIAHQQQALILDPKSAQAHNSLGNVLQKKGRLDEAIEHYQQAIALNFKFALAHYHLGIALVSKGRLDEAIEHYQQALTLDPRLALAHNALGSAIRAKGKVDEAIAHYQQALTLDPKLAQAHANLANALQDKGSLDEAIAHYQQALHLDPKLAQPHHALGVVLLLQGRFTEARDEARHALDLLPQRDPLLPRVAQLLEECERLLALDKKLPGLLKGDAQPADAGERLLLAEMCLAYKKRYAAAARFYAEALKADPAQVRDPSNGHRYDAACAAALAGCRQGVDAAGLDDKECARLRQQAREWLAADLALWAKQANSADANARKLVEKTLQHWQTDSDLAGIRDPEALVKLLNEEERDACRKLWAEVASVPKKTAGQP